MSENPSKVIKEVLHRSAYSHRVAEAIPILTFLLLFQVCSGQRVQLYQVLSHAGGHGGRHVRDRGPRQSGTDTKFSLLNGLSGRICHVGIDNLTKILRTLFEYL
jgi:hypothetical protein